MFSNNSRLGTRRESAAQPTASAAAPSRRPCLTSASDASSRHKNQCSGGRCRERIFTPGFFQSDGIGRCRSHRRAGHCGDGAGRQVRPRDQERRRHRSQPVAARQARRRHPLGHHRGDRRRDPGCSRHQVHRRLGQARDAGPGRSALPRLPVRIGDRHSRRRTGAIPGHHDGGLGGRRRRQQSCGAAALHRRAIAGADLRLRPHRQQRPVRIPGGRALQHRQRPGRSLRDGAGRERRLPDRGQGADVGKTSSSSMVSSR
ncbi:hypothetical protein ABIF29_001846 [Bradyrhizobium elkanii]|uniref:Uncharacterized protein n=1 Tax=Bradyrhizobium elkanii TaxID=29448 RepID=A0ABV4EW88_BRAEL